MQSTSKGFQITDPWTEAALIWMKMRPNQDGTIGVNALPEHYEEWRKYFIDKQMHWKAAFMDTCMRHDRPYMVPTYDPTKYDPMYVPSPDRDYEHPRANRDWTKEKD